MDPLCPLVGCTLPRKGRRPRDRSRRDGIPRQPKARQAAQRPEGLQTFRKPAPRETSRQSLCHSLHQKVHQQDVRSVWVQCCGRLALSLSVSLDAQQALELGFIDGYLLAGTRQSRCGRRKCLAVSGTRVVASGTARMQRRFCTLIAGLGEVLGRWFRLESEIVLYVLWRRRRQGMRQAPPDHPRVELKLFCVCVGRSHARFAIEGRHGRALVLEFGRTRQYRPRDAPDLPMYVQT